MVHYHQNINNLLPIKDDIKMKDVSISSYNNNIPPQCKNKIVAHNKNKLPQGSKQNDNNNISLPQKKNNANKSGKNNNNVYDLLLRADFYRITDIFDHYPSIF